MSHWSDCRKKSQADVNWQRSSTTVKRRRALQIGAATGFPFLSGCLNILSTGGAITVNLTRLQIGQQIPWDEFRTLALRLDSCVLHSTEGQSITIDPTNQQIDLTTMATDEATQIIDSASVPSGTYESADFFLPVTNATMTDGTAATFVNNEPVSVSTGAMGQYLSIDRGVTTTTLALGPTRNEAGNWEFGASIRVPP